MNQSKFERIHSSMSISARKVFSVVPSDTHVTPSAIATLLRDQNVSVSTDLRHITGCLNTLVEAGIVVEPTRGLFKRVTVREPAPLNPVIKPEVLSEFDTHAHELLLQPTDDAPADRPDPTPAEKPATPPATPTQAAMTTNTTPASGLSILVELDNKLASLAKSFSALAEEISQARQLTVQASSAVVNDIEQNSEAVAKLKQLQTLLKGL